MFKEPQTSGENPVAVPAVDLKAKKLKQKHPVNLSPNVLTLGTAVLIFAYLIFASWQAFQPPAAGVVVPQASATPAVPVLKVNQANKRDAPPITVDPNSIGKPDPFSK